MDTTGIFYKLKQKKYKPILDFVEGTMSVEQFKNLFYSSPSLRRKLKKKVGLNFYPLRDYDYRIYNKLTQDPEFAGGNWNTIVRLATLHEFLTVFLDWVGLDYNNYMKYWENHMLFMIAGKTLKPYLGNKLELFVREIPEDRAFDKRIAMLHRKRRNLFKDSDVKPTWINKPEWPRANGKLMTFSHQENLDEEGKHIRYYFFDRKTKEETVVEQVYRTPTMRH